MASNLCSRTMIRLAPRPPRKSALPVMIRDRFEPTMIATTMSSGEACEKVRRPASRMQRMPNAKTMKARTQICQGRAASSGPIRVRSPSMAYFCRGGTRSWPAWRSLPAWFACAASARVSAAFFTSPWIAWSASSSSWPVA